MRILCKVFFLAASFLFSTVLSAQNSIIKFSATNTVTWEVVSPDSIYIQNVTLGLDTTLRGETSFDVASLTGVNRFESLFPTTFAMSDNYPNGFTENTDFSVIMTENDNLTLQVFNILGRQVAEMNVALGAGEHLFSFSGSSLANGVYFMRASTSKETMAIKILKTGVQGVGQAEIFYRGNGGGLNAPLLQKGVAGAGDVYHFTLYAEGFIPLRLENQEPAGNQDFHFDLMPLSPPDDFTSDWRGFNLLGKFTLEWANDGYREEDFQMISEFGFNFVRLPIDYRTYTSSTDWLEFDQESLTQIDEAVAWGKEYGIHVSINLHRAPGYCVNPPQNGLPPEQDLNLWQDADAQAAFEAHWRMFAQRYAHVPREELSFNLVNEPANVTGDLYVKAVLPAIQAIREISPNRIIISDAVEWGNARVDEILNYGVVMSPHFYQPMQITHYKASWIDGADAWAEPSWPPVLLPNYLYGSYKRPLNKPIKIIGQFPKGAGIVLCVHQVSTGAELHMQLDGATIFQKNFQPGPGDGDWREVIYRSEWEIYQNIYDKEYSANLQCAGEELIIGIQEGDWLTISELRIAIPTDTTTRLFSFNPGISEWGVPQAEYILDENGTLIVTHPPKGFEEKFILNGFFQQWIDLKWDEIPVHVGEWGVHNKTPHDVTLAFMENRLKAMDAAGLGWALWNFRGSFGVMDSDRLDVDYEEFRGHKLDRKMLHLLQSFL